MTMKNPADSRGRVPRILWVVPEIKGGIHTYSQMLGEGVREICEKNGFEFLPPFYYDSRDREARLNSIDRIRELKPDIVHLQHEFAYFGRKTPPFNEFGSWFTRFKHELPEAKLVATAHTVLTDEFAYSWRKKGALGPLYLLANLFVVPFWRRLWTVGTFGGFDRVIVHSRHQKEALERRGIRHVRTLPLAVPEGEPLPPSSAGKNSGRKKCSFSAFLRSKKGRMSRFKR